MRLLFAWLFAVLCLSGAFAQFEKAAFVPPRRWALVIGAGKYPELGNLRFAPRDASAFAQLLREDFHFSTDSISLLSDEEGQVAPTTANVRAELARLLADKRLNQGDLFVVFFSGHGVGTPSGDYLAFTDAKIGKEAEAGLPVKEVVKTLVDAGLRNVLFIADACRGGTKNIFGQELTALSERSNLALMLSCLPGKRSMESPRDGHGFFTAALLKGLRDPKLRDPKSGALWASSVAGFVETEVSERTAIRLGEQDRQVPAAFADDRRDVMLGAFLPTNLEPEAVETLKTEAATKDVDRQASVLSAYADSLYQANRFDEAAELLRVVDGLGKLDEAGRMTLGFSLQNAGRAKEGAIALAKEFKDPLISALARVMNESNPSNQDRVRAANEALKLLPGFDMGFAGDEVIGSVGSQADHLSFLKSLREVPMTEQAKTYFSARLADVEGRNAEAIDAYRKAQKSAKSGPVADAVISMRLFILAVNSGDLSLATKVCEEARSADPESGMWPLLLASARKAEGKSDECLTLIQEALKKGVTPTGHLTCLQLAGRRSPEISEELAEAAGKYPRAWKSRLAKILAEAVKSGIDLAKAAQAFEQASRYVDDPKLVILATDATMEPIVEEAFEAGALDGTSYVINQMARASALSVYADELGTDPEAWFGLLRAHLRCFRSVRAWEIIDRHLGPTYREGKLPSPLRSVYLLAALNAGQLAIARKVMVEGGFAPKDRRDAPWMGVGVLIAEGKDQEAASKIEDLSAPSEAFAGIAAAFKGYLDPKVKPEDTPAEDPVGFALRGLKYAAAGDWKLAEPLLARGMGEASWGLQAIHFRALVTLEKRYRETGRAKEATEMGFSAQDGFFSHPMLNAFSMAEKPGVGAYAKSWKFSARIVDEGLQALEGKLELTIDETGAISGAFPGAGTVKGRLDQFGNARLDVDFGGEVFSGGAKLPARDFDLGDRPLTWLLSQKDGRALVFYLTPDKAPAN